MVTENTLVELAHNLLTHSATAALATVDPRGLPCCCNVQFVHRHPWRFYFVSSPHSQHSLNIARSGQVAMTIYGHDDRPDQIHGLQLRGAAEAVTAPDHWQQAWTLYTSKFAFITASEQLSARVRSEQFYCITAFWVRWIDNRHGFGSKCECDIRTPPRPA